MDHAEQMQRNQLVLSDLGRAEELLHQQYAADLWALRRTRQLLQTGLSLPILESPVVEAEVINQSEPKRLTVNKDVVAVKGGGRASTISQTKSKIPFRGEDLTGKEYGKLRVIGYAGKNKNRAQWKVRCKCGSAKIVQGNNLRCNNTTSCGRCPRN